MQQNTKSEQERVSNHNKLQIKKAVLENYLNYYYWLH